MIVIEGSVNWAVDTLTHSPNFSVPSSSRFLCDCTRPERLLDENPEAREQCLSRLRSLVERRGGLGQKRKNVFMAAFPFPEQWLNMIGISFL